MKPNKLLVAILSAAAIAGGAFIMDAESAQASGFKQLQSVKSSSCITKAKTLGGLALGTGLVISGMLLSSRHAKAKAAAEPVSTANPQAEKAATYQALEFPPGESADTTINSALEASIREIANRN